MDISTNNDRFGLPLSLVEALEADPSDDAALLASYLTGDATSGRPAFSAAGCPTPFAARIRAIDAVGDMPSEVFNLDQLLTDPLIQMVMASDHLIEDDIRAVMHNRYLQRPSADCLTGRLAA